MVIGAVIIILGLLASRILFWKFPFLREEEVASSSLKLSVIIPARNEAANIPLLLGDLKKQEWPPLEIIVVDDGSTDETAKIANALGAQVIIIKDKPDDWTGKSWACHCGVEKAKGQVLLFLDADVRLSPKGLIKLVQTYEQEGCALSLQPYHQLKDRYEHFAIFFNIILLGANGLGMANSKSIGLYGPVTLMALTDYRAFGGHEAVKTIVLEDLALGMKMQEAKIPYKLFLGDKDVSFRMYAGGFKDLYNGFMKNFATGATTTPLSRLVLVILWMGSLSILPVHLVVSAILGTGSWLLIDLVFYLAWVLELRRVGSQVGAFDWWTVVFYPLYLSVFLVVFLFSFLKKIFGIKTTWKGRRV